MAHIPVLEKEAIETLNLNENSVVVDCTLGGGGHARNIIEQLGPDGTYIGIDVDQSAIDALPDLQRGKENVHLVQSNFSEITSVVTRLDVGPVDAILADLGWRTDQFESGGKGFSFQVDEPLAMTFGDPEAYTFTAYDIVNAWDESSIADVIYGYGEERGSRHIASAIVRARKNAEIKTSLELAHIVEKALPPARRHGKTHAATKTFQALRIAVNDEFGALKKLLEDGFNLLAKDGHMTIISFHSLEDRIVKHYFRELTHDQRGVHMHKKPIIATEEERQRNPRSRSAKLRTIQKM